MQDLPLDSDQKGAELILEVLADYGVKATFGFVGEVALAGEEPRHCPAQIQRVYHAGHEIASHSMSHGFLPSMNNAQISLDITKSKQALESCIGAGVRGFIPPFNRPMHFPRRGAFSISELLGLHGRGPGRQSIETMLSTLQQAGFGWCRVSFEDKFCQLIGLLGIGSRKALKQPFMLYDMVAIPLHSTGFGEASRLLIRSFLGSDIVLTVYGHANQASSDNQQNAKELAGLFAEFDKERARGALSFNTLGEVERMVRDSKSR